MNKIRLNNEIEMPQVGMGLFQLKGDETQTYIKQLDIGYSEIIDYKNLAVVKGLNLCLGSKKTPV